MNDSACQVVLVSGGSRGLGLAIVEDMLAHGRNVATFSRKCTADVERLRAAFSDRFLFFPGDLQDEKLPTQAVNAAVERFGRLDALISNAAVAGDGILATMPAAEIHRLIGINITGTIMLAREASRAFLLMPRQQRKAIVNVSSILGIRGFRGLSVYGSTKSAMLGLTTSLARELGPVNATVNAVLPGFIETEMSHGLDASQRRQIVRRTPLGRLGELNEIAAVVRFLISPESRFITGQSIVVDGGATC